MKSNKAILVLHEIYGINRFIESVCDELQKQGFAILCPDFLNGVSFPYEQAQDAYAYYMEHCGFTQTHRIKQLVDEYKKSYDAVYILGFSVGATAAWCCSEVVECDGIIACYGSRIRDFLNLQPCCPTELLFAKKDSFDVTKACEALCKKEYVNIHIFDASHGFMDLYSSNYNASQCALAKEQIKAFLQEEL